jgi:hypothetical protein
MNARINRALETVESANRARADAQAPKPVIDATPHKTATQNKPADAKPADSNPTDTPANKDDDYKRRY